jgi:hypothetical protein
MNKCKGKMRAGREERKERREEARKRAATEGRNAKKLTLSPQRFGVVDDSMLIRRRKEFRRSKQEER